MAKKTAARSTKKSTKKTPAAKQADLIPDWNALPKPVREAAEHYKRTSVAKSKAAGKFKSAKESLMDQMERADLERIVVDIGGGVKKVFHLTRDANIKEEAFKADDPIDA